MRRLTALAVAIALTCAAQAQERPEVSITVEPQNVMIGELFTATVTFDLPADHEAIVPAEDADLGGAEVRSVEQSAEALADGGRRHTIAYTVALWEVGESTLTSPAIAVRGPDGAVRELDRSEAEVAVRSVLPEGAVEPRDIRGPREIPLLWHHYVAAALPVLALIGLAALAVWWVRSRRSADQPEETAAPLPPAEEALAALDALESEDLVGEGHIKEHYVQLSWILRNYVRRRWNLPALEETTMTLRHTMLGSGRPADDVVEQITGVLQRADLAKFARHRPGADVARSDIREVREIVHATRPRQEVTGDEASEAGIASRAG